ncbi:hypothetical protein TrRE_jg4739 [Triparma retinervis]|uniref:EIPR1-like beta-propeller domain-containing protein n=1 Tax=Triparma retinervis TaxID=2557542 RepID=A0A9W7EB54_9STRA|nr:hypothetical protein TrRE_jg4739 [Triparma retinervis]
MHIASPLTPRSLADTEGLLSLSTRTFDPTTSKHAYSTLACSLPGLNASIDRVSSGSDERESEASGSGSASIDVKLKVSHDCVAVSSAIVDGTSLYALSTAEVSVHDLQSGSEVNSFVASDCYGNTSFSPDPHSPAVVTVGTSKSILSYDCRSGKCVGGIKEGHKYRVEDVDYNPHRPYYLVSGGRDGSVRFWDIRFPSHSVTSSPPTRVLEGHDHWVTSVRYNPFHDQLVSSSGTDGTVGLWRVSSVSSAPIMTLSETTSPSVLPDARVEAFRNHDESVKGMDWSACDAWCVASVGWGGTVVVDHVGSEEKYRILL